MNSMPSDDTPAIDVARLEELLGAIQLGEQFQAQPLPWTVWTSCSFRRIGCDATRADGDVLHAYNQRSDEHPDLSMSEERLKAWVALTNAAPALLAQLHHLEAELREARAERDEARGIVRDTHWMARRYADGRWSYAVGMCNDALRKGYEAGWLESLSNGEPQYARDGDFDAEYRSIEQRAIAAEAERDEARADLLELSEVARDALSGWQRDGIGWSNIGTDSARRVAMAIKEQTQVLAARYYAITNRARSIIEGSKP